MAKIVDTTLSAESELSWKIYFQVWTHGKQKGENVRGSQELLTTFCLLK